MCAGINQMFNVTFPCVPYVLYFHSLFNLAVFIHPVFISKFKILTNGEKHDNSDAGKSLKEAEEYDDPREDRKKDTRATQGKDGEEGGEGNVEPFLDEDGDLDITRRYKKTLLKSSEQLKQWFVL